MAHDFNPLPLSEGGDAVPFDQMQPIDQYILAKTAELTTKIAGDKANGVAGAYEKFEFHRVYHLLNEFLNSELSAFYLDVLKDRLYTYPIAAKPGRTYQQDLYTARRSAQTAIYKITDALARLTAPILSFTADEVWQSLPGTKGSIHLTLFPKSEELASAQEETVNEDWSKLLIWRTYVLKQIEELRANKEIGKSIEARVSLNRFDEADIDLFRILEKYAFSLPELLSVSSVDFHELMNVSDPSGILSGMLTTVHRANGTKCDRCWRYTPDVGNETNYPTVCLRCAEALDAIDFPAYEKPTPAETAK